MQERLARKQIVHDYFSRAKELIATMVTALDNFKYDMVRLRPVLPCHHSLVDLRVERLPQTFYRFYPMAAQQLIKLLQRNLNALRWSFSELRGRDRVQSLGLDMCLA